MCTTLKRLKIIVHRFAEKKCSLWFPCNFPVSIACPKFKKIVLILKVIDHYGVDKDIIPNIKIVHHNCGMVITGDYVIITEEELTDVNDEKPSEKGKIYELKEIESYKLYNYDN